MSHSGNRNDSCCRLCVWFVHSGMVPPKLSRRLPELSLKDFLASLPPSTLAKSDLLRTVSSDSSAPSELFLESGPVLGRSSFFLPKGENIKRKVCCKMQVKKLLKGIPVLQIVKGTVEILRERSQICHFEGCFRGTWLLRNLLLNVSFRWAQLFRLIQTASR